ncbi:MAG: pirin family protein [Anaerolineae bacterium]|nr:pirin family protein [Anaerolineae bacterium]
MSNRSISRVIQPQTVAEGAGVYLQRSIAPMRSNEYDPFLLFDHFHFRAPRSGEPRGFPLHPHRGIETVTYMLEGGTQHRDSLGNVGYIGAGDVQWMTSGRGILHEEMPKKSVEGAVNGFQLWVNLPAAKKMIAPRYQGVTTDTIPTVSHDGVTVRVIAGSYRGQSGPVTEIAAQPLYADVTLGAGAAFSQPVPHDHTVLAYVFEGQGLFGAQQEQIPATHLVVFEPGDEVRAQSESGVRFLLFAGAPFNEPIVPYGPFVMNTNQEIRQAVLDLQNGTFVSPS